MTSKNLLLLWKVLYRKSTKLPGEKSVKVATCGRTVHNIVHSTVLTFVIKSDTYKNFASEVNGPCTRIGQF
jgi:hypothetical protein